MSKNTKRCPKCEIEKNQFEFYARKLSPSGLSSWCKDCCIEINKNNHKKHREEHNKYQREYRLRNLEEVKAKNREYNNKNREKRNAYAHEYKKLHPGKLRDTPRTKENLRKDHLSRKYGIAIDDWNRMFIAQGGRCLICGRHQDELSGRLAVDHNHRTGQNRGLLCSTCNSILGFAGKGGDNSTVLANAVKYLQERSL